jgi:spoIIIJ-associated protein
VNKTIESEPETQTDPESADEGTVDGAVAPETAPEEAAPAVVTEDVDESDNESDEAGDESSDGEGDDSGDDSGSADEDGATRPGRRERLEHEGDIAADYLEELLEITDLDGDLDMDVEGDRATVSIVGANLPQLVGENGEVLEALQELTRLAVYRETGERSRLMLDVSGHRAARRTALEEEAAQIVSQVKESGEQASLEPMSPFERKVVHDVVAAAGLRSESEGAEPRRYVVVLPQ